MDEEEALKVKNFDARSHVKKYLATEDYGYISECALGDYEDRRDYQDQQLQQLVLDHLAVFVQCKDAIEAVYESDKELFTGKAMARIVDVFKHFRQHQMEPLLQPILSMDVSTNHLRNTVAIAAKNAAVLDLPFHAVRAAREGDLDQCCQYLRSAVSFLDLSKFQRYDVMRAATATNSSSSPSGSPTTLLNKTSLSQVGENSLSGSTTLGSPVPVGLSGQESSVSNADSASVTSSSAFARHGGGGGGASSTTLQPFEIVHRVFAQWLTATEDAVCFALFSARHALAEEFTLLASTRNPFSEARNGGVDVHNVTDANSMNNSLNKQQQHHHHQKQKGGVRLVELEDTFVQILHLLDLLAILRLARYRLLGPRAVEVADAARTASCHVIRGGATSDDGKKMKRTDGGHPDGNEEDENNKNGGKKSKHNDFSSSAATSSSPSAVVQVASREVGVARYLSSVLACGATSLSARADETSRSEQQQQRGGSGGSSTAKTTLRQQQLDANSLARSSHAFVSIFGDPKPIHPLLVFCHLFERSLHVSITSSVRRLELELRAVEITLEQQSLHMSKRSNIIAVAPAAGGGNNSNNNNNNNSNSSGGKASAAGWWWTQFVAEKVGSVRLAAVPPDEMHRLVPNRCVALARSLLRLMQDGITTPCADGSEMMTTITTTTISLLSTTASTPAALDLSTAVLSPIPVAEILQASDTWNAQNSASSSSSSSSTTTSSWHSGKSEDDVMWFSSQSGENLRSFRKALSCVAPPLSCGGAVTTTTTSSSTAAAGGSSSSSAERKEAGSVGGSSINAVSTSTIAGGRHRSLNCTAVPTLNRVVREALRGIATAWRRLGPMLSAGTLCRDGMDWEKRAGVAAAGTATSPPGSAASGGASASMDNYNRNKPSAAAAAAAGADDQNPLGNFYSSEFGNNNDLLRATSAAQGEDEQDQNGQQQQQQLQQAPSGISVQNFISSCALYRRLLPSLATFSTTIPQRVLDHLSAEIKTAKDLLIAACRFDLVSWFRTLSRLIVTMLADLIQADLVGFFLALSSLSFSHNNNNNNNSSASSSSATTNKDALIESELAATVRRWSGVINHIVRETLEMRRILSLECKFDCAALNKTAALLVDPFSADVPQRFLLGPVVAVFTSGLRRVSLIVSHFRFGVKSPAWILREIATATAAVESSSSSSSLPQSSGNKSAAAATSSGSAVSGSSFSDVLEAFVAETRQSLAPRFGHPIANDSDFAMMGSGGSSPSSSSGSSPPCSQFSVALVKATSQLLIICAPLLRVVDGFDSKLCALVRDVIGDSIYSVLAKQAANVALMENTVSECRDAECASWLAFLSVAPFDESNSGGGGQSMRQVVCREFAQATASSSSSSSSLSSSSSNSRNNFTSASASSHFLSASPTGAFFAALSGMLRLSVAEAAVADAFAISTDLMSRVVQDNLAATLTFKSSSISDDDDMSIATISALLSSHDTGSAAAIDNALNRNAALFQQVVAAAKTTVRDLALSVYRAATESLTRLTLKNARVALDSWTADLRSTGAGIDAAVIRPRSSSSTTTRSGGNGANISGSDNNNNNNNTSIDDSLLFENRRDVKNGVRASIDVFAALCQTLAVALRWRARLLVPLLLRAGHSDPDAAESQLCRQSMCDLWAAVVEAAVRVVAKEQQQLREKKKQRQQSSSSLAWQENCLSQLCRDLCHLVEEHILVAAEQASASPSEAAIISALASRAKDWMPVLSALSRQNHGQSSDSASSSSPSPSSSFHPCCVLQLSRLGTWATASSGFASAAATDPRSVSIALPMDALDNFLRRDMPLEFEAHFTPAAGATTNISNNNNNTGDDSNNNNWWSSETRGAERREMKLLRRRQERTMAAQQLVLEHQQSRSVADAAAAAEALLSSTVQEKHSKMVRHMAARLGTLGNTTSAAAAATAVAGKKGAANDDDDVPSESGDGGGKKKTRRTRRGAAAAAASAATEATAITTTTTTTATTRATGGRLGRLGRHAEMQRETPMSMAAATAAPASAAPPSVVVAAAPAPVEMSVASTPAEPVTAGVAAAVPAATAAPAGGNPFARRRHHAK